MVLISHRQETNTGDGALNEQFSPCVIMMMMLVITMALMLTMMTMMTMMLMMMKLSKLTSRYHFSPQPPASSVHRWVESDLRQAALLVAPLCIVLFSTVYRALCVVRVLFSTVYHMVCFSPLFSSCSPSRSSLYLNLCCGVLFSTVQCAIAALLFAPLCIVLFSTVYRVLCVVRVLFSAVQ